MQQLDVETFDLTGDTLIDGTTQGSKWVTGAKGKIQWSISKGWRGEAAPEALKEAISAALETFEDIAGLDFVFVGSFNSPDAARLAGAEMNFAIENTGFIYDLTELAAIGGFPNFPALTENGITVDLAGDVLLNGRLTYTAEDYLPGGPGFSLLLHEIGHTLGLKHPHDDAGSGRPTFDELRIGRLDKDVFSIMSYDDASNSDWPLFNGDLDPRTPMLFDILALHFLYGANEKAHRGDTKHVLEEAASYRTIYDAKGKDTLDVSGSKGAWKIALPASKLSKLVDTKFGLALPSAQDDQKTPNTLYWLTGDIENIRGSGLSDELLGNALANRIAGGDGRDRIVGKQNDDTVIGGAGADKLIAGKGDDTALGGPGKDHLVSGKGGDRAVGGPGADIVKGNKGRDEIIGGKGDDTLIGGPGADSFVFAGRFGHDTIRDFELSQRGEVIDLSKVEAIRNWKDLQENHLEQSGKDAVIKAGPNTITISDVKIADLSENDFLF